MRIAAYEHDGAERLGLVTNDGGGVRPLPAGVTLLELLAGMGAGTQVEGAAPDAGPVVPLSEVRLLAPLHPASMRDFVSFERHVEGAAKAVEGKESVPERWYEAPTFLFMNPHSAIGSGEPVPIPPDAKLMDYELEVGVVLNRDGRDLTPEQAHDLIAGYLVVNDWSARDLQAWEMRMGLGPAKGKDFATTLGPWLVTPDELEPWRRGDRLDLAMRVSVNGVELGADRLSNMAWSFEELIAYATRGAWVRAGDVICSGTCSGGALAELWGRNGRQEPPPLQAGDVVTMTVEGIGTISNQLVKGAPEATPVPVARRLPRPPKSEGSETSAGSEKGA